MIDLLGTRVLRELQSRPSRKTRMPLYVLVVYMKRTEKKPKPIRSDPFELLQRRHTEIAELLAHTSTIPEDEPAHRIALACKAYSDLSASLSLERVIVFSYLERYQKLESLLHDLRNGQEILLELLDELQQPSPTSLEWLAKLIEIRQTFQNYRYLEEEILFEYARNMLIHEERNVLYQDISNSLNRHQSRHW